MDNQIQAFGNFSCVQNLIFYRRLEGGPCSFRRFRERERSEGEGIKVNLGEIYKAQYLLVFPEIAQALPPFVGVGQAAILEKYA